MSQIVWHPVADPPGPVRVLVTWDDEPDEKPMAIATLAAGVWVDEYGGEVVGVTYWAFLPELPNEPVN